MHRPDDLNIQGVQPCGSKDGNVSEISQTVGMWNVVQVFMVSRMLMTLSPDFSSCDFQKYLKTILLMSLSNPILNR